MSKEDRNNLAVASSSSLHFCERIRQVRDPKHALAAEVPDAVFPGSESGDLTELEATFLRSGAEMAKILASNPEDPDVLEALRSHDARKVALGL